VDLRLWYLWERLNSSRHTFTAASRDEYRRTLRGFAAALPRLSSPVVEQSRRSEYRVRRETPISVYKDGRDFGRGGTR